MTNEKKARLICYYLPQYHPIPENDEWWGKGFTEWTNAAKAKPLFKGHCQPHIPADLGFYDLRLPEARIAQAELAREYGVEGFCYWHYWFNGKRLLERPFNEVLKSGEPKFPFCLGWANESWTGVWHGTPGKTLMEQTYPGREDEINHFSYLLEAFKDDRYIKVDGKPLLLIYKPQNLPSSKRLIDFWQELAISAGLKGIYFVGEDWTTTWNPTEYGFDATVPHSPGNYIGKLISKIKNNRLNLLLDKMGLEGTKPVRFNYKSYIDCVDYAYNDCFRFPSVLPNWDNTPRCGLRGVLLEDSSPGLFRIQLEKAVKYVSERQLDKRIIFVKSWNEWAEGNYLEPDLVNGRAYLDVCKQVIFSM